MDGGACRGWPERLSRALGSQKWWRREPEDPDMSFLLCPANHFVMDLSGPFLIPSCCFRGGPCSPVHSADVVYVRLRVCAWGKEMKGTILENWIGPHYGTLLRDVDCSVGDCRGF